MTESQQPLGHQSLAETCCSHSAADRYLFPLNDEERSYPSPRGMCVTVCLTKSPSCLPDKYRVSCEPRPRAIFVATPLLQSSAKILTPARHSVILICG